MDEDNTEWDINRVPPQIKSVVESKINELEEVERGEKE